jgi:acid phosphatase
VLLTSERFLEGLCAVELLTERDFVILAKARPKRGNEYIRRKSTISNPIHMNQRNLLSRTLGQTIDTSIALAVIGMAFLSAGVVRGATDEGPKDSLRGPGALPIYDHVVIVMEENKDYEDVIGRPEAPYINEVLRKEGASFTKAYGEEHCSEGNYFWLLSGANQHVGFKDAVPAKKSNAPNLAQQLAVHHHSFAGYSENLPKGNPEAEFSADHLYARKHVPWVTFSNIPRTCHRSFKDFPKTPAQFSRLPTVSIVVPNQENDMHNIHTGGKPEAVHKGDEWLRKNLDAYYRWAKRHNSLLIVTFDEGDDASQFKGLTNPSVPPKDRMHRDLRNQIPTIFAGAHIKAGDYTEGNGITHVNILRTIEAMYHLAKCGAQQPNALASGIADNHIITDAFNSQP